MGNDERWYFTKEQLENSPSRQCGIDSQKEMHYRQQAATFIKDMGHKLNVSQLCMSTAIVYMHRFYVFHSFTHFPWHSIAAAALFLAAKVEEQPRKVEYVVKVAYMCKNHKELSLDQNADKCQVLFQDLVFNENILLQTLGFDVAIDHPHSHIVKCCHLVRAGKELAHTSYIMASNSLQITTMCLQYKPTVVACFCIHVACKWSQWEIPLSNEKKEWFSYVDPTVTAELLQQLTDEFLTVFDAYKVRLKHMPKSAASQSGSPFDHEPKPGEPLDIHRQSHHGEGKSGVVDEAHKYRGARPHEHGNMQQHREREYREKRERERLAQQQNGAKLPVHPGQSHKPGVPHHYHRSDAKQHSRPPMPGPSSSHSRQEPRDILREVTKDMGLRDPKREQSKDRSETIIRDMNRDHQHVRDKNMQKRDHLLKPNVTETNSVNNYQDSRLNFSADKQRVDALRSTTHVDPSKVPPKYDQIRRHDEVYVKNENEIKKHLTVSSSRDKNAAFLSKSAHSTSQKPKMPFTPDASKSVPKHNVVQTSSYNGSNSVSNTYNLPVVEDVKVKQDSKPEMPIIHVKKPSLFSPEQTSPPKKISLPVKSSPVKQEPQTPSSPSISSFTSSASDQTVSSKKSNIPDAVLRPVMKKIDQVEGFQDIMKNPSSAVKLKVPDIITPIKDSKLDKPSLETQPCSFSKEMKPPDLIPPFSSAPPIVNGIETDAALISNLLKETPSVPHLPAVAATSVPSESKEKQHHHKEHKKKNKEKHKHKDKDRSKEEKEKKKKHKDKDREKHKKDKDRRHEDHQPPAAQPIKITIQKEKIHPVENSGSGLKIKISKDLITNDTIIEHPRIEQPQSSLKIKIPREIIDNYAPSESKKRERDRSSPSDAPPNKMPRSSSSKHSMEPKQNGRHSVNKVSNNNVPTSQYRPENVSVATTMFQSAPTGYYYYPNMQVPPPNLSMNPNMNMPPPNYVYPPYYGHGYVYSHPHEIYSHPIQTGSSIPPPLPADAPPDVPPPPPPE